MTFETVCAADIKIKPESQESKDYRKALELMLVFLRAATGAKKDRKNLQYLSRSELQWCLLMESPKSEKAKAPLEELILFLKDKLLPEEDDLRATPPFRTFGFDD
jgi:hypothetical protein